MKGQKQFYLLQCSPHFHQSVLLQLSRSGIAYYNPVIRTFYKRRDCSAYRGQIMPMFPGYVFVLLDFEVVHPSCFTRMKNVYGRLRGFIIHLTAFIQKVYSGSLTAIIIRLKLLTGRERNFRPGLRKRAERSV